MADLGFELGQAPLDEALALARGVVLRVLGQVAVLAGFGQGLDDARPLDRLQTIELRLEPVQAFFGHWEFVHLRNRAFQIMVSE